MATIEILGVPHAYELTTPIAGSSHALVFIHGWLLSRGYWQPIIEQLSSDFQCLAYDLRGFGQSQLSHVSRELSPQENISNLVPYSCYTAAAYAQDLVIMLEKLNITSVWLIGHSLGGSIALWAAQQIPERVQGVICVNAGGGIYLKEAFEQFRSWGSRLIKYRPRWLCYLPLLDLLFTRANVAQAIAPAWGRQRLIDFVVAHPEAALGTLLDSTTEAEINRLPKIVSQLQQPVYFITGDKDQIMEPKYVRHLASFHPLFQACGNNVMEISHCGHLAMIEHPQTVANQIRLLLEQHKSSRGT
jgi:pimeloyl-ACP methyl ester carboxylesterase